MKTCAAFITTLFTLATCPLLAQQPPPASQTTNPATQQNPSATMSQTTQPASPAASPIQMSPVDGERVSKLDTKTAKAGDSVVIQTKAAAKTTNGTEIPEGSKLVGRVVGVHASAAGDNSQVALQFDHLELKGGQNMTVHSEIQSIALPAGAASAIASANPGGNSAPQSTAGASGASAAGNVPAPGTIIARTGNIAVRTTSIPGVMLANNAPGQQDPRMAQASGILLGAKQDIQLDGGTQMVLGIAASGGGAQ